MPLKIDLKPGEKMILNGAVLTAGKGGVALVLENKATILRGKDILKPEEVNTPARHIYFNVMLMYIDPENKEQHRLPYRERMLELANATTHPELNVLLREIGEIVANDDLYNGLRKCRELMDVEDKVLNFSKAGSL